MVLDYIAAWIDLRHLVNRYFLVSMKIQMPLEITFQTTPEGFASHRLKAPALADPNTYDQEHPVESWNVHSRIQKGS